MQEIRFTPQNTDKKTIKKLHEMFENIAYYFYDEKSHQFSVNEFPCYVREILHQIIEDLENLDIKGRIEVF